jgi:hypothetical protein
MGDCLNLFVVIGLSPAGRPLLAEGEVEIQWIDDVNIQTNRRENIFPSQVTSILLTNMNIIVLLPQQTLRVCAWTFKLQQIERIEDCASAFRSSKRIRIHVKDGRQIEIKFLSGKKETAMEIVHRALQRKSWEQQTAPPKAEEVQFSVKSAGISGLIRRQEREHQSNDAVKREALTDLDTLMSRAKEVVGVIERYAHVRFDKVDDRSDTSSEIGPVLFVLPLLFLLLILSITIPPLNALRRCSCSRRNPFEHRYVSEPRL